MVLFHSITLMLNYRVGNQWSWGNHGVRFLPAHLSAINMEPYCTLCLHFVYVKTPDFMHVVIH